jgi:hypothetical protein
MRPLNAHGTCLDNAIPCAIKDHFVDPLVTTADGSRIEIDASELDNGRRSRVFSRNLQRHHVERDVHSD